MDYSPAPSAPELPAELQSKSASHLNTLLAKPKALHGLLLTQTPPPPPPPATPTPVVLLETLSALPELRNTAAQALKTVSQLESEFSALELQMYKSLQPYYSLSPLFQHALEESDTLCETLSQSFIAHSHSDDDKDDEVARFVNEYRAERKKFYWRKEVLERWNENRIGNKQQQF